MHRTKKQLLSSALLSLLLVGCGEGSGAVDNGPKVDNQIVVNMEFAATYLQSLGAEPFNFSTAYSKAAAVSSIADEEKEINVDRHYHGQMKVTNNQSGEQQLFDWSVIQKADGKIVSQPTLPLKSGCYDFDLVLTLDGEEQQYAAKTQGREIIEGMLAELDFVLSPIIGESITDLDDALSLSTLMLEVLPEEIAALSDPQFGLSINGGEEKVFTINKVVGEPSILLNVDPGYHRLTMHLYEANLIIGKNDKTVNVAKGKCRKMTVRPLQASVDFNLTELKDQGTFTFTIPDEVVDEVGSVLDLALIVRLAGDNVPVQERVLTVRNHRGLYKARELFATSGQNKVDAYLAFHRVSEASEGFHLTPFASCNMAINLSLNQGSGCQLDLKRERIDSGNGLGTLVLKVRDQDLQPASGVKVYVDGKLVGLTGNEYSSGSLKTHLAAGEHEIRVFEGLKKTVETIVMESSAVENMVLNI